MEYEKAQEISSSSNWEEICKELDTWIQAELNKLKTCMPEDLPKIQQTIRDYERVKNLPRIVTDRTE
jgi:hypothetical protein